MICSKQMSMSSLLGIEVKAVLEISDGSKDPLQTTAYDPASGFLYVPLLDNNCMDYSAWQQKWTEVTG